MAMVLFWSLDKHRPMNYTFLCPIQQIQQTQKNLKLIFIRFGQESQAHSVFLCSPMATWCAQEQKKQKIYQIVTRYLNAYFSDNVVAVKCVHVQRNKKIVELRLKQPNKTKSTPKIFRHKWCFAVFPCLVWNFFVALLSRSLSIYLALCLLMLTNVFCCAFGPFGWLLYLFWFCKFMYGLHILCFRHIFFL